LTNRKIVGFYKRKDSKGNMVTHPITVAVGTHRTTPLKVTKLSNVQLLSTDLKGYTVTFVYKDGIRQEVPILAPTIGEVLRVVGVRAKRVVGKAVAKAREIIPKVGVAIGKVPYALGRLRALPEELRREYERGRFERVERPTPRWDKREILRLVDMTKSGDVSVRVMARAYLRKFYPEVYSELIKEAKVGR